jgi:transposase-like protein
MAQKRQRRKFSKEFKREILARVARGEAPAVLAEEYDLGLTMISSWKRQLRDEELDSAVDQAPRVKHSGINPKYVRHLEEKLRESNEKLGQLFLIVEDLKKTPLGSMRNASSFIVTGTPWGRSKGRVK